jgi:hypothetical protein
MRAFQPSRSASMRRKGWAVAAAAILLILGAIGIAWLNPQLTHYLESDRFRAELEKETAKGLHFPAGHYAPIHRKGFLAAAADRFQADNGRKALRAIDARGITATFNPWGVFIRRWQLDDVRIDSGEVEIQTYTPKPEPSPAKPWFHLFLPQRVYLKHVEANPADVTWRFRGEKGGFFGTDLVITPHGLDFNYQASGGTLKMALIPNLRLRDTHLLITRKLLTLYNLDLQPGDDPAGSIHAEGKAGTGEDRSVDFNFNFEHIPVEEWLPKGWREHVRGNASGKISWRGKDPKLENSTGEATLRMDGGRIIELPFLENVAKITKEKALERLTLNDCSFALEWNYPRAEIKNIAIEEKGKFRAEGRIQVEKKELSGAIELGVARYLLDWLPKPEEVFPHQRDGYLWTTVHLSGTIEAPQQDLSPRIMEVLKENPGVALGLLLRQFGEWLKNAFGGE